MKKVIEFETVGKGNVFTSCYEVDTDLSKCDAVIIRDPNNPLFIEYKKSHYNATTNFNGWCPDTLSQSEILVALTQRIGVKPLSLVIHENMYEIKCWIPAETNGFGSAIFDRDLNYLRFDVTEEPCNLSI